MAIDRIKVSTKNREKRYLKVQKRFSELCSQKVDGMSFDYEDIVKKVADEYDYSPRTVKDILKKIIKEQPDD